MFINVKPVVVRTAVIALAVSAAAVFGVSGEAAAQVKSGSYTSTTLSSGVVLLQRPARVEGNYLVLIGRYRIHPTAKGGYVDLFPGHRVFMNNDGHGGYSGPAYFNGALIGSIKLTPRH